MKEIYDLLNKYEAILAENKESIHNNKNKKMKREKQIYRSRDKQTENAY